MKSPVNAGLCTLTHNITLEIDTRSLGAPEIKEIKFFKMCLLDGHFCGV
jgi:hypothetical protein